MSLITLQQAKLHLRVDGSDEDALILAYIGAAESMVVSLLDRNVYATEIDLKSASVFSVPVDLSTSIDDYNGATAAARGIADQVLRAEAIRAADIALEQAKLRARKVQDGIVMNDAIRSAALLIIGHLYANREDVVAGPATKIPNGAEWLLQPYKAYAA